MYMCCPTANSLHAQSMDLDDHFDNTDDMWGPLADRLDAVEAAAPAAGTVGAIASHAGGKTPGLKTKSSGGGAKVRPPSPCWLLHCCALLASLAAAALLYRRCGLCLICSGGYRDQPTTKTHPASHPASVARTASYVSPAPNLPRIPCALLRVCAG
jgi:hypothetical protein